MANRRYPTDLAYICRPTSLDFKTYLEQKNKDKIEVDTIYTEPIHKSPFSCQLKKLKPNEYEETLKCAMPSREIIGKLFFIIKDKI